MKKFIEQLENKEQPERWKSVVELSKLGKPALEHIAHALDDDDKWVRYVAADALGSIHDPTSVDHLIHALHDVDQDVRFAASYALGALKDPKAIPALEGVCTSDNCFVRVAASEALETLKH